MSRGVLSGQDAHHMAGHGRRLRQLYRRPPRVSGLVGGDGLKMRQYAIRGKAMSGGYVSEVIAEALSMAESNACMRRIVAAPRREPAAYCLPCCCPCASMRS